MKMPYQIYYDGITAREMFPTELDTSKCYMLGMEFPDTSMNIGKFICSETKQYVKISYQNIINNKELTVDEITKALEIINKNN